MSKIQKFKTFLEASAADLTPAKKDDDETKKLKPRSKGEQDFADAHTTETEPHPTADPSIHNGATNATSVWATWLVPLLIKSIVNNF